MIGQIDYTEEVLQDLQCLKFDAKRLIKATQNSVDSVSVEDILVDEQITVKSFELVRDNFKGYTAFKTGLQLAKSLGRSLIQDGDKIFVLKVDDFLKQKREHRYQAYVYSVQALINGHFYAHRAKTNGRLHTNFTELPKCLLKVIKEDNDLVEIDLANSQYALLAYMLTEYRINTPDAVTYKQHAGNGTLYEFMMKEFGTDRDAAKEIMMRVVFGKKNSRSEQKNKFKQLFPTVANFVSNYKKEHGDNELPIGLQQVEARLFIDIIYPHLKGKYGFVISKHDSFIVRRANAEDMLTDMYEIADSIGFKCTFKIS